MKQPRIRLRVIALTLAALSLVLALALAWMTIMPGTSHRGPLGAPDPTLRAGLERDVTALSVEIGERNTVHPLQLVAAQQYIEEQFHLAGLIPSREGYRVSSMTCSNIIADIKGTSHASEIVVVGAHYDSAQGSPGANDNATGVAAMLALARRFAHSPVARTLRFVAFVNEEPPWFQTDEMGSRVNARASKTRNDDIRAMISLETLGCYTDDDDSQRYPSPLLHLVYPSRGNFITFVSNLSSRSLLRDTVRTFREHAQIPSEGGAFPVWVSGVGWSDHESFWREGFDAVMVTDTAVFRDPNYHRRTDTIEHVDLARLTLVVEGLVPVLKQLANPTPHP